MSKQLWNDCNGGIITTELLLVSSVLVAGLLSALGAFRASIEGEFHQLGNRIQQSTHAEDSGIQLSAEPMRVESHRFEALDLQALTE